MKSSVFTGKRQHLVQSQNQPMNFHIYNVSVVDFDTSPGLGGLISSTVYTLAPPKKSSKEIYNLEEEFPPFSFIPMEHMEQCCIVAGISSLTPPPFHLYMPCAPSTSWPQLSPRFQCPPSPSPEGVLEQTIQIQESSELQFPTKAQ